ncbi:MAG: hypothetical protein K6G65_06630 [Lachnospiraceae bacterium]|nr:hypothetical protein [Lachnospiraceae bacterium]
MKLLKRCKNNKEKPLLLPGMGESLWEMEELRRNGGENEVLFCGQVVEQF